MNRTMNEDTAENRDCSNDTDHVKKDKGAYAEPLPESFRPRRDGPVSYTHLDVYKRQIIIV